MKILKTPIDGLYLIEPEPRIDDRGYFARIFCTEELDKAGIQFPIVQANHSFTKQKGTIRGMHFQSEPKSEGKIVLCLRGSIYDVAIDLRSTSPTYLQWFSVELSETNKKMLYIPKGFAHGLQTLTSDCLVQYFMSEFYSSDHAKGVRWNDPKFNIKWPIYSPFLSEQDKSWPLL